MHYTLPWSSSFNHPCFVPLELMREKAVCGRSFHQNFSSTFTFITTHTPESNQRCLRVAKENITADRDSARRKTKEYEHGRDRTCNLLIRSQAPCHWATHPVMVNHPLFCYMYYTKQGCGKDIKVLGVKEHDPRLRPLLESRQRRQALQLDLGAFNCFQINLDVLSQQQTYILPLSSTTCPYLATNQSLQSSSQIASSFD
jgi:hypothetical protein